MRIAIVEDEPPAAALLQETLQFLRPAATIVATCPSVREALAFLTETPLPPDLLFLDIELADGTAFDLLEQLPHPPPCIFCTAYNQYYQEAFRTNGIAYVLKPFAPREIEEALAKLEALQEFLGNHPPETAPRMFLIREADHTLPVAAERVAAFHWQDASLLLETVDGQRHSYGRTLDTVEREVSPEQYFRIARAALVRRTAVAKCHLRSDRRLEVELTSGTRLIVSRSRVRSFQTWLQAP